MDFPYDIENHGTIILIRPHNLDAAADLRAIVDPEAQWFGDALAVEPRYADDIINHLRGE